MTYHNQGVAKRGVNKSDHGIIYTGRHAPEPTASERPRRGEAPMLPNAVRVNPDSMQSKLSPMARINYSKVYDIEHNAKVRSLGMVDPTSMEALMENFMRVWLGRYQFEASDRRPDENQRDPRPSDARVLGELGRLAARGLTLEQAQEGIKAEQAWARVHFEQALLGGRTPKQAFEVVTNLFRREASAGKVFRE